MAVSNQDVPNLSSSYANIQEALKRRGNLELGRPQALDIATNTINRVDQELSNQRKFAKQMKSEGRLYISDQGINEYAKRFGDSDESRAKIKESLSSFQGTYQKPEALADYLTQIAARDEVQKFNETISKDVSLTDTQKAAARTPEGRKEVMQKLFSEKTPHVITPDKNSSTGYYYATIDSAGNTVKTNLEAPKPKESGGGAQGVASKEEKFLLNTFLKESKNFKEIGSNYLRVKSSAKDPSAAGDLSLIFAYMKMLDPTSVVREGEQASAENARGVPESLRAQYNKVINGKKLSEDQRKDFTDRANRIYSSEEKLHAQREGEIRNQAILNEVDPDKVVIELRPVVEEYIDVIRPDGKRSRIPPSQLNAAMKKGYKRAE